MNVVATVVSPTLILWARASGLESLAVVPASTVPCFGIAPVRARIASSSVVFPLWNGPTSAMHRGPRGLLTSCPICRLLFWSTARREHSPAKWLQGRRRKILQFELERRPFALPYPTVAESAPAGRPRYRFSLFAVWQGKCSAGCENGTAAKCECSTF